MASGFPTRQHRIHLGEGVELDPASDELYRGDRKFKLERIPASVLLLLVERRGELVRREDIVERVWGKSAFLDTDNSLNSAIRKIRQALKDDPDSPRFIQTISGRGYRFLVHSDAERVAGAPELEGRSDVPSPLPVADPVQAAAAAERRGRFNVALVLPTAMALLAVAAAIWLLDQTFLRTTPTPSLRSLAVLPLENLSGDPSQEYLADGMTESIIGRLSAIRELRVISRTSVMRFKDTKLTVPEIAKQLNVDAIVEGSVIREGNRIRVHAQLIRAASDAHIWAESYDRELKDVLSLQSDVAQAIADKVEVTITGAERQRLVSVTPVPPEVYEKYLRGQWTLRNSNDKGDVDKSIGYFQQAIEKDPTFAPAYLGLANAYMNLSSIYIGAPPEEMRRKALEAGNKALELDPQSAEAHIFLAGMYQGQWQWAQAEAELQRTLQLNPNNAAAHDAMAHWLSCQGRTEEALTWARRARALDPGETVGNLIWILFVSRHHEDAIRELRSVLALTPDDPGALWNLGYNLIAIGQPEQAIPPLEKALTISHRSPGVAGVLIRAYAHAGRRDDALRLLAELKQRQKAGYVPAGAFINAYLGLDDTEQAFAALEQGYKEHSNILQFLKVHPHFDPIRNDPRFRNLLHRVGLD